MNVSETPNHPISYCVYCDKATPGACEHAGAPRYIDSMPYQRVSGGWRVSDQERPRWDYDGWLRSSGSEHWKATPNPGRELPTLQAATEALEDAGVYLDQGLRIMFTDAYDIDPKQTTQAAFHVARTANSLDNPSGLLAKRLREIT